MIDWTLPIKLVSPNTKEHWTKTYKRNKQIKKIIWAKWKQENINIIPPCKVTITRVSPRAYDDDNFISSAKPLRDAIADLLCPGLAAGRADSNQDISWHYCQKRGLPKQNEVRIQIE